MSWLGSSVLATLPWLLMTVPPTTPAFTRASKVITALERGAMVPLAADGEFTRRPAASGDVPPSGRATGVPLSVTESVT